MVASGTVRTATENLLIELIGALEGFTTALPVAGDGRFMVSGPPNGKPRARRWVVIGAPTGPLDPDGMAASHDPSIDVWTISCGLALNDVADAQAAKQAAEDALNAIADALAVNERVGDARDVAITTIDGPRSVQVSGEPRFTWIDFDISAFADIFRNPT